MKMITYKMMELITNENRGEKYQTNLFHIIGLVHYTTTRDDLDDGSKLEHQYYVDML
jgi:hypothetical protein